MSHSKRKLKMPYQDSELTKKRKASSPKSDDDMPLNIGRVVKRHPITISLDSDEDDIEGTDSEDLPKSLSEPVDSIKPVCLPERDISTNTLDHDDPNDPEFIRQQLAMDETYAQMIAADLEADSEYEIEKIVSHTIFKGKVVQYEIKWKGYGELDNTLEMANGIHSDVYGLCEAYWDGLKIQRPSNAPGYGKERTAPKDITKERATTAKERVITKERTTKRVKSPVKTTASPMKKRSESIVLPDPVQDAISMLDIPRCLAEKGYTLPTSYPHRDTSWSDELKYIETIQKSPLDKTTVLVYLDWKNGEKTVHTLQQIHQKCPKDLIDYYEARLKFV